MCWANWKLRLYPGGCLEDDDLVMEESRNGYIGLFLSYSMPEEAGDVFADVLINIKMNSGENCPDAFFEHGWGLMVSNIYILQLTIG